MYWLLLRQFISEQWQNTLTIILVQIKGKKYPVKQSSISLVNLFVFTNIQILGTFVLLILSFVKYCYHLQHKSLCFISRTTFLNRVSQKPYIHALIT